MEERFERETRGLIRAWMRHDRQMLRHYLVEGAEGVGRAYLPDIAHSGIPRAWGGQIDCRAGMPDLPIVGSKRRGSLAAVLRKVVHGRKNPGIQPNAEAGCGVWSVVNRTVI